MPQTASAGAAKRKQFMYTGVSYKQYADGTIEANQDHYAQQVQPFAHKTLPNQDVLDISPQSGFKATCGEMN